MSKINAFKMHGLGNQFLIIDRRNKNIELSKHQIQKISSNSSTKFDQLLFLEKDLDDIVPIRIFNSNGIEVNACGNGARCVAYLLSLEKEKKNITLKTQERVLEANILSKKIVSIDMGKPLFAWDKIPLREKLDTRNISLQINKINFLNGFTLNIGNPHIIFFVDDCFKLNLREIGPKIENHNIFPEKCNVTFSHLETKNKIFVNVWERGAGLTKACGTAACATAIAGYEMGLSERNVQIIFQEGKLNLEYKKDSSIIMSGPVSNINKISLEI